MAHTITKKILIEEIALKTGKTRDEVGLMLHAFLDQMVAEWVQGNRIEFRDFGVFEVRQRAARKGKNPKTNQELDVPPRRTVKFKPGAEVKKKLDESIPAASSALAKPIDLNTRVDGKADLDHPATAEIKLSSPRATGPTAQIRTQVGQPAKPQQSTPPRP